jgi:hypothetical protein
MQHFSFVMNAINCKTDEPRHPVTLTIIATEEYLNGVTAVCLSFVYLPAIKVCFYNNAFTRDRH